MTCRLLIVASLTMIPGFGVAMEITPAPPSNAANTSAPFDWSGLYVGLRLGYGWQNGHFTDNEYNVVLPDLPPYEFDVPVNGASYAIETGYNWQAENLVYGLVGELGHMDLAGSAFPTLIDLYGDPYDAAGTFDGGWYASLAARLGYALDRTLVYAKAGGLYSGARVGFLDTCTTGTCGGGTIDGSREIGLGIVLGAGAEQAITDNLALTVEYNFNLFGSTPIVGTGGGSQAGNNFTIGSNITNHQVKLGLNYRF